MLSLIPMHVFQKLEERRKTGRSSSQLGLASKCRLRSAGEKPCLRRIGHRNTETGKRHEFLTNYFRLPARTIANSYKERWQIEIFFREIKQSLWTKSFVGTSKNAVLIQSYTALTTYLLLAYQNL